MYSYTGIEWVLIFYIYCFFGWIFESTVVSVQQRRFVNRGFLKGPMLPIYSFGATIMLHVALPLAGHPVLIYFAGAVVATVFEYFVGVLMETLFKVKYWDYSSHKFQFQGRICLQSTVAWGFLTLALMYWLHHPVAAAVGLLGEVGCLIAVLPVSLWFVYDVYTSAKAAFEVAAVLTELEKIRAEAEALREKLEEAAEDAKDDLLEKMDEVSGGLRERLDEAKGDVLEHIDEKADDLRERLDEARQRREEKRLQQHLALREAGDRIEDALARLRKQREALERRNPTVRVRIAEAAREWREKWGE